jgi:hypothetical protein
LGTPRDARGARAVALTWVLRAEGGAAGQARALERLPPVLTTAVGVERRPARTPIPAWPATTSSPPPSSCRRTASSSPAQTSSSHRPRPKGATAHRHERARAHAASANRATAATAHPLGPARSPPGSAPAKRRCASEWRRSAPRTTGCARRTQVSRPNSRSPNGQQR